MYKGSKPMFLGQAWPCVAFICSLVGAQASRPGPYDTKETTFVVPSLDSTNQVVDCFYPVGNNTMNSSFRLLSYTHGFGGGGIVEPVGYFSLFRDIASFGYVVVAPRACDWGCRDDHASLPHDPNGFAHYYKQQLLAIEWAAAQSTEPFDRVDFARIGIAGHSMGGQATLFSSSGENASAHNITASVLHHAYSHEYPSAQVPMLVFTGTTDTTALPSWSKTMYEKVAPHLAKGFVNRKDTPHWEPITHPFGPYHPELALFTAAWLKLFVDKTPFADGLNYEELLFGSSNHSLCGGGDGSMEECEVSRASMDVEAH